MKHPCQRVLCDRQRPQQPETNQMQTLQFEQNKIISKATKLPNPQTINAFAHIHVGVRYQTHLQTPRKSQEIESNIRLPPYTQPLLSIVKIGWETKQTFLNRGNKSTGQSCPALNPGVCNKIIFLKKREHTHLKKEKYIDTAKRIGHKQTHTAKVTDRHRST